ncbi:MAG: D-ribose transporter subunit RbsB [Rhizobium sp.]|nr:D-ribose transporter subunit RbsB [Rhizobium sp.]
MRFNIKLSTAIAATTLALTGLPGLSSAQDVPTIGATTYSRSFEFYQDIEAGMKEEGGDKVNFDFKDPNGDLAVQTSQMEDFVAKGVKLVTMVPIDSKAGEAAARLVTSAGIPLITVDIAITADVGQVAHIASDNHFGGEIAAKKMAELLGGKGEVLVINNPAIVSVVEREKGFVAKLAEIAPDIKVVASQSGDSKREKAQAVAEDLLQAHPEATGIFAVNDEMALGALQAVIAAGRQDKMNIIGFDASSEGISEIAKGTSAFKASVAQDPVGMGKIVTRTALAVLKGEKVDKFIPVPVVLVDKSNYTKYAK